MRLFIKKWLDTILGRMLCAFLLLLIPVYFGGASVYRWGTNAVRQEISSSMIAQVRNFLGQMEREIRNIDDLALQTCVNDYDLDLLSSVSDSMSPIEKTLSFNRLQLRLKAIKSSNRFVEAVNVYFPSLDRMLSADNSVQEMPGEDYNRLIEETDKPDLALAMHNGSLYLSASYPQRSKKPRIVEIVLSTRSIKSALLQIDDYSDRGTLLIGTRLGFEVEDGFDPETTDKIRSELLARLAQSDAGAFHIIVAGKPYLFIYSTSPYLGMTLCKYLPEEQVFQPLQRYRVAFWIFTGLALIIVVLFAVATSRIIHHPLHILVDSFHKVEGGNMDVRIEHRQSDEFRYLYKQFNDMVYNLNVLINQNLRQRMMAQRSEMKQLQSQINPHFLYNSFFSLHSMVAQGEYEQAEIYTQQLGTYFQYITRSGADEIELEREAAHARIYTEIQARRFRNRIRVQFDELPEAIRGVMVPRLILQPVIENAFVHGLKDTLAGGTLKVSFACGEGWLEIHVMDNGDGTTLEEIDGLNRLLQEEEPAESTGIINIHKRIRMMFGPASGLALRRAEPAGLLVVIRIEYDDAQGRKSGCTDC